jgi:glycosyltransferase involved in cell wall biosynthesis
MRPKILIIGPIEDFGGRELEAGFVASALKEEFDVNVLSTGNLTIKSQFHEIVDEIKITSLKQLLFERNIFLRPATLLSYLKNRKKEPVFFYINNKINSRYIKKKENAILKEVIQNYDLIFIIAHLQTLRTKEIIQFSRELQKAVIFRTTGEIELSTEAPTYLNKVSLFIHHSQVNANKLHGKLKSDNYAIIDQNSYMESHLLNIPVINKKVERFVAIARLAPEKNLFNLISFFQDTCENDDELLIVGTGILYPKLYELIRESRNIKLIGHLSIFELNNIYDNMDCAVIPAYTEAGPLVGIDAMAAGKIILSTKVGAMWERLQDSHNDFWFQPEDKDSFKKQFERIKNLSASEVHIIAEKNRNLYIQNYSTKEVSDKYRNSVSQLLQKSSKACS